MDISEFPTYRDLILPVLRAVQKAGGSAQVREIKEAVIESEGFDDKSLAVEYPTTPKSVLIDRIDWARSYAKLMGALDSPRRGFFILSELGNRILDMPHDEAVAKIYELDAGVRARRNATSRKERKRTDQAETEAPPDDDESPWRDDLLARLHRLTPEAFERFVVAVLRSYGMELTLTPSGADEGIDAIGRAPITKVMSTRVAVQVKRYEPTKTVGRETVALLQRDAAAAGAEKAILVTLARFSGPAEQAAVATTPMVDLIDGDRLCDLVGDQETLGVRTMRVVEPEWFDRFEP